MSDTSTTSKPEARKSAGKKTPRGAYVVYDKEGNPRKLFSGEVDALRAALSVGGSVQFKAFGEDL